MGLVVYQATTREVSMSAMNHCLVLLAVSTGILCVGGAVFTAMAKLFWDEKTLHGRVFAGFMLAGVVSGFAALGLIIWPELRGAIARL